MSKKKKKKMGGGRSTEKEKKSVCMREREGVSYKESASLRATQRSRDKLHLNNSIFRTAWWLYANTEKVCALVHICTYMQLCMCDPVYETRMHSHVQCVSLPACSRKKTSQEALKGIQYLDQ